MNNLIVGGGESWGHRLIYHRKIMQAEMRKNLRRLSFLAEERHVQFKKEFIEDRKKRIEENHVKMAKEKEHIKKVRIEKKRSLFLLDMGFEKDRQRRAAEKVERKRMAKLKREKMDAVTTKARREWLIEMNDKCMMWSQTPDELKYAQYRLFDKTLLTRLPTNKNYILDRHQSPTEEVEDFDVNTGKKIDYTKMLNELKSELNIVDAKQQQQAIQQIAAATSTSVTTGENGETEQFQTDPQMVEAIREIIDTEFMHVQRAMERDSSKDGYDDIDEWANKQYELLQKETDEMKDEEELSAKEELKRMLKEADAQEGVQAAPETQIEQALDKELDDLFNQENEDLLLEDESLTPEERKQLEEIENQENINLLALDDIEMDPGLRVKDDKETDLLEEDEDEDDDDDEGKEGEDSLEQYMSDPDRMMLEKDEDIAEEFYLDDEEEVFLDVEPDQEDNGAEYLNERDDISDRDLAKILKEREDLSDLAPQYSAKDIALFEKFQDDLIDNLNNRPSTRDITFTQEEVDEINESVRAGLLSNEDIDVKVEDEAEQDQVEDELLLQEDDELDLDQVQEDDGKLRELKLEDLNNQFEDVDEFDEDDEPEEDAFALAEKEHEQRIEDEEQLDQDAELEALLEDGIDYENEAEIDSALTKWAIGRRQLKKPFQLSLEDIELARDPNAFLQEDDDFLEDMDDIDVEFAIETQEGIEDGDLEDISNEEEGKEDMSAEEIDKYMNEMDEDEEGEAAPIKAKQVEDETSFFDHEEDDHEMIKLMGKSFRNMEQDSEDDMVSQTWLMEQEMSDKLLERLGQNEPELLLKNIDYSNPLLHSIDPLNQLSEEIDESEFGTKIQTATVKESEDIDIDDKEMEELEKKFLEELNTLPSRESINILESQLQDKFIKHKKLEEDAIVQDILNKNQGKEDVIKSHLNDESSKSKK